jgi:hypothetical protein
VCCGLLAAVIAVRDQQRSRVAVERDLPVTAQFGFLSTKPNPSCAMLARMCSTWRSASKQVQRRAQSSPRRVPVAIAVQVTIPGMGSGWFHAWVRMRVTSVGVGGCGRGLWFTRWIGQGSGVGGGPVLAYGGSIGGGDEEVDFADGCGGQRPAFVPFARGIHCGVLRAMLAASGEFAVELVECFGSDPADGVVADQRTDVFVVVAAVVGLGCGGGGHEGDVPLDQLVEGGVEAQAALLLDGGDQLEAGLCGVRSWWDNLRQ